MNESNGEHGTDGLSGKGERSLVGSLLRMARVGLALMLIIVVVVKVSGVGERLAYFPFGVPGETPGGYEDVTFTTPDGLTLHGWFLPAQRVEGVGGEGGEGGDGRAPTVLHAHGNAGNVSSHDSFSAFLSYAGFNVFVFDYRSYGRSDGGALRRGPLMVDTQAAFEYLQTRSDVDPARIGVMGVSLGGAFALGLGAQEPEVRAVATISTFSSWKGIASDSIPVLGGFLMPGGLDQTTSIAQMNGRPVLVMHGGRDRVIDVKHATILEEAGLASGVDVRKLIYDDADHNSLLQRSEDARAALIAFFRDSLGD